MNVPLIKSLRSAFAFLSRLPVGPWPLKKDFSGIAVWLPVVGAVLGSLAGVTFWGFAQVLPPLLAAVFTTLVWVMLTGGLHLDGVADCGDGMIPEVSKERRLEIMKDSRVGTFGVLTLVFTLLIKIAALTHIYMNQDFMNLFVPCLIAGMLSRSQLFLVMCAHGARPGGMGEAFRKGTRIWDVTITLLCVFVAMYFWGMPVLIAAMAVMAVSGLIIGYAYKRLGGVTGDVFGLSIETTEWVVLVSFCLYF